MSEIYDYYPWFFLEWLYSNNIFSHAQRKKIWHDWRLWVPSLVEWVIDDCIVWSKIVFEEYDASKKQVVSCVWLEHFVINHDKRFMCMDNHNHALFFWFYAQRQWRFDDGVVLVHIDQHSDLWDYDRLDPLRQTWPWSDFFLWEDIMMYCQSMYGCHIGNFIKPALDYGMFSDCVQLRSLDALLHFQPDRPYVLDVDIDFWADGMMSVLDHNTMIMSTQKVRDLYYDALCTSIATSPFFMDQHRACHYLKIIFW